jgi:hypothetical protein
MLDRDALIAAARAKRAEHMSKDTQMKELQAKLEEKAEVLSTVANMFSATVWNLLPQKIKDYFKEYRK